MSFRTETDSLGEVKIPIDKLWGSQTQRCVENFKIGRYKMPNEVILAYAHLKKACAEVNVANGDLPKRLGVAIVETCNQILSGAIPLSSFPLTVFQTGSGTQTNMNVNEVISNAATVSLGGQKGEKIVHPNDHVNRGQSSNDTFPSAMHIATALMIHKRLIPALDVVGKCLEDKVKEFHEIIKCGRTHTMDATPMTLGQEFSAFHVMITMAIERVKSVLPRVLKLAIGGTAVGTGLNTREDFGQDVCAKVSSYTKLDFRSMENKFEGLSCHDTLVEFHGVLNTIACSLMKIGNDIRFLSSGPRCGIGEILIPSNEPGSSIMPGKVNPTQCESLTMVCCQVMGNQTTVSIAGSNGHFQLNVFKPVIIFNVIESMELISDVCLNFTKMCLKGIKPNKEQIKENLGKSLMLVTALNPVIGYDNAGKVAKKAYKDGISLKEAAKVLGLVEEEKFDEVVDPKKMIMGKVSKKDTQ